MLDRERVGQHSLTVFISDKNIDSWSCKSTVVVKLMDVNDCAPKFESDNITASVVENAPVGSVVTMVHAVDEDLGEICICFVDMVFFGKHFHLSVVIIIESWNRRHPCCGKDVMGWYDYKVVENEL